MVEYFNNLYNKLFHVKHQDCKYCDDTYIMNKDNKDVCDSCRLYIQFVDEYNKAKQYTTPQPQKKNCGSGGLVRIKKNIKLM